MLEKDNNDWSAHSDKAILKKIGQYLRQVRLEKNLTQENLAHNAGLNRATVIQIENGESVNLLSLIQIIRSLDILYVFNSFIVKNKLSPLQLAKLEKNKRKRARGKKPKIENTEDGGW